MHKPVFPPFLCLCFSAHHCQMFQSLPTSLTWWLNSDTTHGDIFSFSGILVIRPTNNFCLFFLAAIYSSATSRCYFQFSDLTDLSLRFMLEALPTWVSWKDSPHSLSFWDTLLFWNSSHFSDYSIVNLFCSCQSDGIPPNFAWIVYLVSSCRILSHHFLCFCLIDLHLQPDITPECLTHVLSHCLLNSFTGSSHSEMNLAFPSPSQCIPSLVAPNLDIGTTIQAVTQDNICTSFSLIYASHSINDSY
jgi:hypothetical protein